MGNSQLLDRSPQSSRLFREMIPALRTASLWPLKKISDWHRSENETRDRIPRPPSYQRMLEKESVLSVGVSGGCGLLRSALQEPAPDMTSRLVWFRVAQNSTATTCSISRTLQLLGVGPACTRIEKQSVDAKQLHLSDRACQNKWTQFWNR